MVGDDLVLLRTRAEMLGDWQITAVSSWEATEALSSRKYDRVIFGQTVRERLARKLIDQARGLNSGIKILVIHTGEGRKLASSVYEVDLCNPSGLRWR